MLCLTDLHGLWRRTMIAWPDGREDATTEVYWLQGPSRYADLRIPSGRPKFGRGSCLRDLEWPMLRFMARQEGFIGHLEISNSTAHWHRAFDYQPEACFADKGRLEFEGDILVEHGVETPYVERWRREPETVQDVIAVWLAADASRLGGCLIAASNAFIYARGRAEPLPRNASLSQLLDGAASLRDAQALFDCEISFGRRDCEDWKIERSSLPFREGQALGLAVDAELELLSVDDLTPEGASSKRSWRIVAWESTRASTLLDWFASARALPVPAISPASAEPAQELGGHAMNKTAFTELPVIDISALLSARPDDAQEVAEELRKAAREVGFCYITGHGIADAVFSDLRDAAERFFALSLLDKMMVYIGNSRNHRGYVPEGEEVFAAGTKDRKEAFDLSLDLPPDDPDYARGNPLLGPNQWPEIENFREPVMAYYHAVFSVGRVLMRGFALALGEGPDFFDAYLTKPPSQLRLIHYPHNPEAGDAMGIGAHTDYECLTLLHSTAPGLEVLNSAGQWIDAPPVPGAFVINIGDMMEVWTNGEFVATSHRVRPVKQERFSFPLFFAVDYHTRVAPLERFVSAKRPPREGLIAGEHLLAQTAQSFNYQKARLERGEIQLPEKYLALSSFGQEARYSHYDNA